MNFKCEECNNIRIEGKGIWIDRKAFWFCKSCYLDREEKKLYGIKCGVKVAGKTTFRSVK